MDENMLSTMAEQLLREGASLVKSSAGPYAGSLVLRPRGTNGAKDSKLPIFYEERCVLIVDLVGWSKKPMEEQYALVESMNGALLEAETGMHKEPSSFRQSHPLNGRKVWDMYKGTGDGGIFVFGKGLDASYVREALQFAARAMAAFQKRNQDLAEGGLNKLSARMALAYGRVFLTEGLDDRNDILGDAINLCSRLVTSSRALSGSILVEDAIYHCTMTAAETFYRNEDGNPPSAGQLSEFVVGSPPDGNNFLYLQDDGLHETKDRILHAYNLSGRLDGIDIQRVP